MLDSAQTREAIARKAAERRALEAARSGGVDVSFTDAAMPAGVLRFDLSVPEVPPRPKGPPILR